LYEARVPFYRPPPEPPNSTAPVRCEAKSPPRSRSHPRTRREIEIDEKALKNWQRLTRRIQRVRQIRRLSAVVLNRCRGWANLRWDLYDASPEVSPSCLTAEPWETPDPTEEQNADDSNKSTLRTFLEFCRENQLGYQHLVKVLNFIYNLSKLLWILWKYRNFAGYAATGAWVAVALQPYLTSSGTSDAEPEAPGPAPELEPLPLLEQDDIFQWQ